MKRVEFTPHAEQMLVERQIERAWALEAAHRPERIEDDPTKSGRKRAFRRVADYENRWLRIVFEPKGDGVVVITVFFDRGAGRWP